MKRASIIFSLSAVLALGCGADLATSGRAADVASSNAAPGNTRTIVFVHGAFADGSSWDRVVPILEGKGYNVVAVHQPLTSLADDVAATRRILDREPGDVVLVGHSYGGAVITEAGVHEKVRALVYVAAFTPDRGESANDLSKDQPAPAWASALIIDQGFGRLPFDVVAKDFAQDLSASEARLLTAKQGPLFMKALDDKVANAAWHDKPSFYVQTTMDHMIPPAAQAQMAQRIQAKLTPIEANHVVMLSKPAQVAEVILAAAASTAR